MNSVKTSQEKNWFEKRAAVQEWWYHAISAPLLFAVGNYSILIGPAYFSDVRVFLVGTLLVAALYLLVILSLKAVIRRVIDRFPEVRQTPLRLVAMLVSVLVLISLYVPAVIYIYSQVPLWETRLETDTYVYLLILGFIFSLLFCLVHSWFYTLSRWNQHSIDNEHLRKSALQSQLEALKTQVNPHFLFNSLNSLSSLINEDPDRAEKFVDELSKVYRYLLQTNDRELTSLATELRFVQSYYYLLQTRHGAAIDLTVSIGDHWLDYQLPPLTLQLLLENAVKHNALTERQPLAITLSVTADGNLSVRNTRRPKTLRVASTRVGLNNLASKFRLLNQPEPTVVESNQYFEVVIPLIYAEQPAPESV